MGKIASLFILMLTLSSCSAPSNTAIDRGDMMPAMKLHDLNDHIVYSRERFSGKVIVFNVWATWCPPCRKEMPDLQRLSTILPRDRYSVVALSVDRNLADVKTFVHEHGLRFPVFWDQGGASIATPKLGVFKYPETFIVNREGRVVVKVIGAYPWASDDTVKALKYIAKFGKLPRG